LFEDPELSQLREVVSDAIGGGRLGSARFLRCHAVTDEPGLLGASLTALTSLGDAWFGSSPTQAHRLGEDSGVYLTEMLKWRDGQGAIVTVSVGSHPEPRIDLLLIGSKGSLYHQG
jgi:hypothetical protein